jgi:hypothetical protein
MGKKEISDKVSHSYIQPPAPKRALSAFFLYRGEVYDKVKADNPTAKITEITRIISDMWGSVEQSVKDRLEAEYQKNKVVAQKDKAEYEDKYGKIERKKKKKRISKEDAEDD